MTWAKQNGPVTYGHAGNGSPSHLVMEYFRLLAGFKTIPVPYRGAAPMVADLLTGVYKAAFGSTSGLLPQVAAGKLRALAVSTAQRSPLAPDVPTIAESGYPGFNLTTDFILMAPGGTPDEIVERIQHDVHALLSGQGSAAELPPSRHLGRRLDAGRGRRPHQGRLSISGPTS